MVRKDEGLKRRHEGFARKIPPAEPSVRGFPIAPQGVKVARFTSYPFGILLICDHSFLSSSTRADPAGLV